MAQAFANEKMFTCIHKHYSVEVIKYIYLILILGIFNFFLLRNGKIFLQLTVKFLSTWQCLQEPVMQILRNAIKL